MGLIAVIVFPDQDQDQEKARFVGFPKTLIAAGGGEVLLDSIRLLKERMEKDLGENVVYVEPEGAFHDYVQFAYAEPERSMTLDAIYDFLL